MSICRTSPWLLGGLLSGNLGVVVSPRAFRSFREFEFSRVLGRVGVEEDRLYHRQLVYFDLAGAELGFEVAHFRTPLTAGLWLVMRLGVWLQVFLAWHAPTD